jgi:hypothetical protein
MATCIGCPINGNAAPEQRERYLADLNLAAEIDFTLYTKSG